MKERLEREGVRSEVVSPGGPRDLKYVGWCVVVQRVDADRARRTLLTEHLEGMGPALDRCPRCRYDLNGLATTAVCPECGSELGAARAAVRAWSVRMGDEGPEAERFGEQDKAVFMGAIAITALVIGGGILAAGGGVLVVVVIGMSLLVLFTRSKKG